MPHSDEFVALCLVLAVYDMAVPLAVIIERHEIAQDNDRSLPFGPRDHSNFCYLIDLLPKLSKTVRAKAEAANQPVQELRLEDVAGAMLAFDYVRAGDTDVWWYVMEGSPPRSEKTALRNWLESPNARDPGKLKQFLEELYDMSLP